MAHRTMPFRHIIVKKEPPPHPKKKKQRTKEERLALTPFQETARAHSVPPAVGLQSYSPPPDGPSPFETVALAEAGLASPDSSYPRSLAQAASRLSSAMMLISSARRR